MTDKKVETAREWLPPSPDLVTMVLWIVATALAVSILAGISLGNLVISKTFRYYFKNNLSSFDWHVCEEVIQKRDGI